MSSTNKTPFLDLNNWLGTDVPTRVDFVRDNNMIDVACSRHFNDNERHITKKERDKWNDAYIVTAYTGDGKGYKIIDLPCDFNPKFGYVHAIDLPPNECDFMNHTNYHYAGFFTIGNAGEAIRIEGKRMTVKNINSARCDTEIYSFNRGGVLYEIVGFR